MFFIFLFIDHWILYRNDVIWVWITNFCQMGKGSDYSQFGSPQSQTLIIFFSHYCKGLSVTIIYFNRKRFCNWSVYQQGMEIILFAVFHPLHCEWVVFHSCIHFLFSYSFLSSGQFHLYLLSPWDTCNNGLHGVHTL